MFVLLIEEGDEEVFPGTALAAGSYFVLSREQAEEIAFALEEKAICEAAYEDLQSYVRQVEKERNAAEKRSSVMKGLAIAGAAIGGFGLLVGLIGK